MSVEKFNFILDNELLISLSYIIDDENNYWFKGSQIAKYLEYVDATKAIINNVDEQFTKSYSEISKKFEYLLASTQAHTKFINESGLYQLTSKSSKSKAVEFRLWLYGEVVPKIRKTGQYNSTTTITMESNLINKFNSKLDRIDEYMDNHVNQISKFSGELDNVRNNVELVENELQYLRNIILENEEKYKTQLVQLADKLIVYENNFMEKFENISTTVAVIPKKENSKIVLIAEHTNELLQYIVVFGSPEHIKRTIKISRNYSIFESPIVRYPLEIRRVFLESLRYLFSCNENIKFVGKSRITECLRRDNQNVILSDFYMEQLFRGIVENELQKNLNI